MTSRRALFAALAGLFGARVAPAAAAPVVAGTGAGWAATEERVRALLALQEQVAALRAEIAQLRGPDPATVLRKAVAELRHLVPALDRLTAPQRHAAEWALEDMYSARVGSLVVGYSRGDGLASLLRSSEAALANSSIAAAASGRTPCTLRPSIPSAIVASAPSTAAIAPGGPAFSAATSAFSSAAMRARSSASIASDIESSMGQVGTPMVDAGGTGPQRPVPLALCTSFETPVWLPVHAAHPAPAPAAPSRETLSRGDA